MGFSQAFIPTSKPFKHLPLRPHRSPQFPIRPSPALRELWKSLRTAMVLAYCDFDILFYGSTWEEDVKHRGQGYGLGTHVRYG